MVCVPFTMKTGPVKRKEDEARLQTRREALEWERIFLQQKTSDLEYDI